MGINCRGICSKYAAKKPRGSRYAAGQKRCQTCQIFINWEGLNCPCCGFRLRLKPRGSYYKEKMKLTKAITNF